MKGQIKRILAILFAVLFVATLTASAVSASNVATLTASAASIDGGFIPNPDDPDSDGFWWLHPHGPHPHGPYGPHVDPDILQHYDRFKFDDSINFQELTQNGNALGIALRK